ncbi:MAG: CheR family methyltransferase [Chloroflexota bacterium]
MAGPSGRSEADLTPGMKASAQVLVARHLGLDFPERRWPDLARGLADAARAGGEDLETYLERLCRLPPGSPDLQRLAGHLTVGETYFFRDRACFDALERAVLPALIAARRAGGSRRLRLWSAGCAAGEEPYSLAMLLDRLLPDRDAWAITILATDINSSVLDAAQSGRYREWSFRETPEELRRRYFQPREKDVFELDPAIRRMVTFAPLNLAQDGYPAAATNTSAMDLILCRNVLMYFTPEARLQALSRLQCSLTEAGWLAVSAVEGNQELMRPLLPINFPGATLYRKAGAARLCEPLVPGGAGSRPPETAAVAGTSPDLGGQFGPPNHLTLSPSPIGEGLASVAIAAKPSGVRDPFPRREGVGVEENAKHDYESLPENGLPTSAAELQAAWGLADQGNLEGARRLCAAVLVRDALDPGAYLLMAAIAQEQGEPAAALEAAHRAVYLAPDSAPAHFLLGSLLFGQGQARRARRCMETVTHLLDGRPPGDWVDQNRALTAGRLIENARAYLELLQ